VIGEKGRGTENKEVGKKKQKTTEEKGKKDRISPLH